MVSEARLCSFSLISYAQLFTMLHHHYRLPKIKGWIDAHNPGDPLIPFSVALEERLAPMTAEEKAEELKKIGTQNALGKITQAGYSSLDVRLRVKYLYSYILLF